jgi:putative transposase
MRLSFFNLLRRERIRRRKYKAREEARRDVVALRRLRAIAYRPVDYIEFFYNPQRKHVRNGMLSPIAFEQQQKLKLQGVYRTSLAEAASSGPTRWHGQDSHEGWCSRSQGSPQSGGSKDPRL